MESMRGAVSGIVGLYQKKQINSEDVNLAVNLAILQISPEQAIKKAATQLFSGNRLGDSIDGLSIAVRWLSITLRDGGVEQFEEGIGRIRRVTNLQAPRTEFVLVSALQLAEMVRQGQIKVADFDTAVEIALQSGTAEEAMDRAQAYAQQKGLGVDDAFFGESVAALKEVELGNEGNPIFNTLVGHMNRLVLRNWAQKRKFEAGDTISRHDPWEWEKVTTNLPKAVAEAWVIATASYAEISGYQNVIARDALKPGSGYGWTDKLAVVVEGNERSALAIILYGGKYWLMRKDYHRGGGR